jgi:hypothetical protein
MTPRLLCRDAAAEYCGMSPNHFEEHVSKGVPLLQFGKRNLWDVKVLDRWLDQRSGLAHDADNAGSNEWDSILENPPAVRP